MQCPLMKYSCCFLTPKVLFAVIGFFGAVIGVLSLVSPQRSIKLYQWIMEKFNWKVMPIDEAREVRNTRFLGLGLTALSALLGVVAFTKF